MAIVSGFSASRQDILPYSKCDGRPAAPRGINVIALKRRGVDLETRTSINRAFKILTSGEYNTSQAIEKIRTEIPVNEYIENMISFIESSKLKLFFAIGNTPYFAPSTAIIKYNFNIIIYFKIQKAEPVSGCICCISISSF